MVASLMMTGRGVVCLDNMATLDGEEVMRIEKAIKLMSDDMDDPVKI